MTRAGLVAHDAAVRRLSPRVHGAWTASWWQGDAALVDLLGPAPSWDAFDEAAARIDRHQRASDGLACLEPAGAPPPDDALVVLAGQQPVLGGGPGLVAHKAATAIRLAALLTARWSRPVLAVFLLATEDHDADEVDHVDHIDASGGRLLRTRCRVSPGHDRFAHSRWDAARLSSSIAEIAGLSVDDSRHIMSSLLAAAFDGPCAAGFAAHVGNLLLAAFGRSLGPDAGLRLVSSHRLTDLPAGRDAIARAIRDAASLGAVLAEGARRAERAGLRVSFDPGDPRPLVMESSDGRRRRLDADDAEASARQASGPRAFSPHAALRPIVQARTLPVVAQVVGPSELAYLGQARRLHALLAAEPPVLVPRLEATHVSREFLEATGRSLDELELDESPPGGPVETALGQALDAFAAELGARDPGLRRRAERLAARTRRDARRLAESLAWRGRTPPARSQHLNPRGRPQDTVLAWLPDAWAHGDPAAWGRRIVGMAQPLDPPRHVLAVAPSGES